MDITKADLDRVNILPDTRVRDVKKVIRIGPMNWVPIFCANCGADGGRVPEENCDFCFYLCDPCAEKWSFTAETYVEPNVVFWEKVRRAQIEKYGRVLTEDEVACELDDEASVLSKLAKERNAFVKR